MWRSLSGIPFNKGEEMRNKIILMMCFLLLATLAFTFAEKKKDRGPRMPAAEYAKENEAFKRNRAIFNNEANTEIRAKSLAEKASAEEKMRMEAIDDKGEGQVKVKF